MQYTNFASFRRLQNSAGIAINQIGWIFVCVLSRYSCSSNYLRNWWDKSETCTNYATLIVYFFLRDVWEDKIGNNKLIIIWWEWPVLQNFSTDLFIQNILGVASFRVIYTWTPKVLWIYQTDPREQNNRLFDIANGQI